MNIKHLTFLFLLFLNKGIAQEFENNLERLEILPVAYSNFKEIIEYEHSTFYVSEDGISLASVRRFVFKEGKIESISTYGNKNDLVSKEDYLYDESGQIIKIIEETRLFGETSIDTTKIVNKFNNKNQLIESKHIRDDKIICIRKFSDYTNNNLNYKIIDLSIGMADNIKDKEGTILAFYEYENGIKKTYKNGNNSNMKEFLLDQNNFLNKKEYSFVDEIDSKGNGIKRFQRVNFLMDFFSFYKIKYLDKSVSGSINYDKDFINKHSKFKI